MKFRVVFIGKTNAYKEIMEAAKTLNQTAKFQPIGLWLPDDSVEVEVSSVDEGEKFMKDLYDKVHRFPKRYDYVDGDRWWSKDWKTFLGTSVFADRYDYKEQPKHLKDFDKLLGIN